MKLHIKPHKTFFAIGFIFFFLCCTNVKATSTTSSLDISPWKNEIIYFLMTDRFYDGNKENNDQKKGEFGNKESQYNGGDLAGIEQKIPYLKELGVTAIWITPPVANQWWMGTNEGGYGGYHGYWAENFKEVDKHLGTLKDYQRLVQKLHAAGFKVIQDIVTNHTGNFFELSAPGEIKKWKPVQSTHLAPSQPPFDLNNGNKNIKDNIYHFNKHIENFDNDAERFNGSLSDLDDLNTENPVVIKALIDSYQWWIDTVGIDAFRIDTVKYVPPAFWKIFLHTGINNAKGILHTTNVKSPNNFFAFAEIWVDTYTQMNNYINNATEGPLFASAIDFPLQSALVSTFQRNISFNSLAQLIKERQNLSWNRNLVTFVDNHDMPRWLENGSEKSLRQALGFIYSISGIPCLYYGTEQGLKVRRAAMFKEGFASQNQDHFETNSKLFKYIAELNALHTKTGEFKDEGFDPNNSTLTLENSEVTSGLLYKLQNAKKTDYLIVFNNGEKPIVLELQAQGATDIQSIFSESGSEINTKSIKIDKTETKSITIASGAFRIYRLNGKNIVGKLKKETPMAEAQAMLASELLNEKDPMGDDNGSLKNIAYPTDSSFSHQGDILGLKAEETSQGLQLTLEMANITKDWSPAFGFDHVSFHIYLDNPNQTGSQIMPFQNANLPSNFNWDYAAFVTGWMKRFFTSTNAGPQAWGDSVEGFINAHASQESKQIIVNIPFPPGIKSFSEFKIYITTWDHDGINNRLRPLNKEASAWSFSTSSDYDIKTPLILDSIGPFILKKD